uniref:Secreted protein n=1 Tax=Heterorhabditis bacteriophora TaxID=37862 RepID=A0A1I7WVT9_HETBA
MVSNILAVSFCTFVLAIASPSRDENIKNEKRRQYVQPLVGVAQVSSNVPLASPVISAPLIAPVIVAPVVPMPAPAAVVASPNAPGTKCSFAYSSFLLYYFYFL